MKTEALQIILKDLSEIEKRVKRGEDRKLVKLVQNVKRRIKLLFLESAKNEKDND